MPDVGEEDQQIQSVSHRYSWPADEFATVTIDIKKFLQFLAGQLVNPERVICSMSTYSITAFLRLMLLLFSDIVDKATVQFFLLLDDLSLQYFIPVVPR